MDLSDACSFLRLPFTSPVAIFFTEPAKQNKINQNLRETLKLKRHQQLTQETTQIKTTYFVSTLSICVFNHQLL